MPLYQPVDYTPRYTSAVDAARKFQGLQADKLSLEESRREAEQLAAYKMGLQALDTANPDAVRDFHQQYPGRVEGTGQYVEAREGVPETPEEVREQYAFKNEQERDTIKNTSFRLMQGIKQAQATGRPELFFQTVDQNAEGISGTGDTGMTPQVMKQLYQENPEALQTMIEGTYRHASGEALVGGGAEYGNFYFDDAGNPLGFNKSTNTYERIQTPSPKGEKAPQVVVQTGDKALNKAREIELGALATSRVKRFNTIRDDALQAEQQIDNLEQIRTINLDTGFGTQLKSDVARVVNFLGGDGDKLLDVNVADVEKFNAVAERQVLDVMANQKGPQTDQDAARIKRTVAQTGNKKEANAFILNSMEALSRRKIEQAQFWDDYLESNDTLDGVNRAWNTFKRTTPMVSEVVNNPKTGQPMFFYQFRDFGRSKNVPDNEIVTQWRELIKKKRSARREG